MVKRIVQADHDKFIDRRTKMLMNRADLAMRSGVTWNTVQRLEEGYHVRADSLRKILAGLGLTVDQGLELGFLVSADISERKPSAPRPKGSE